MRLSEEKVEWLANKIASSTISSTTLRDDLLDHFCCTVEHFMQKGLSFEDAFEKAKIEIAPNGLNEIQKETVFLLNNSNTIKMRKLMFAFGLIFAIMLSLGSLFKLMYWPYANMLLMIGILGMGFVFLPLVLTYMLRNSAQKVMSEKLRNILGVTAGMLFALASLFKIFHLMGADILLVLSFVIFTFGFLPFTFFKMYKKVAE